MSHQKNSRSSGYSLALILCACAVGAAGILYAATAGVRRSPAEPVLATEEPKISAAVPKPSQPDLPRPDPEPPAQTTPAPQTLKICRPLEGELLCGYAEECLAFNETTRDWRTHKGIDIGAQPGAPVAAAADGEVYTVYNDDRMGTTVVIRHPLGYTTKYASLSEEVAVSAGETVTVGQTIGTVGHTALMESALGDHLHFSVTKDDAPMDPAEFLGSVDGD